MIRLENVTKKYGSVSGLRDVSLQVPRGKIVGLLGRNGAGKTTAMNLISGYFPPTAGRILIGGADMAEEPRMCKRKIGYLPERPPLYDEMSVTEYLGFVSELKEVAHSSKSVHIREIIGLCGLEEVRNRLLGQLSRGYRQRAGIAQALCGNPELLILDEPTAGLDPKQTTEIRKLIRTLGRDHTILFSSHLLPEVQQVCTDAVILHEGRIVREVDLTREQGGARRLRIRILGNGQDVAVALRKLAPVVEAEVLAEHEGTAVIRLISREKPGAAEDAVCRLLTEQGISLRELTEEQDSLEDIFLRATAEGVDV